MELTVGIGTDSNIWPSLWKLQLVHLGKWKCFQPEYNVTRAWKSVQQQWCQRTNFQQKGGRVWMVWIIKWWHFSLDARCLCQGKASVDTDCRRIRGIHTDSGRLGQCLPGNRVIWEAKHWLSHSDSQPLCKYRTRYRGLYDLPHGAEKKRRGASSALLPCRRDWEGGQPQSPQRTELSIGDRPLRPGPPSMTGSIRSVPCFPLPLCARVLL